MSKHSYAINTKHILIIFANLGMYVYKGGKSILYSM